MATIVKNTQDERLVVVVDINTALEKMDNKIDKLDNKIDRKIGEIDTKIDKLENKFTEHRREIEGKIENLENKFDKKFDKVIADNRWVVGIAFTGIIIFMGLLKVFT